MKPRQHPRHSPPIARTQTRGSTNKQILTLDHQSVRCEEYAKSHNWVVDKTYEEHGISSTHKSWDKREEIVQALRDAERGEYDYLVVWSSDRLSRDPGERELLITLFRRYGVEVHFADPKAPRAERSILTDLLNSLLAHYARIEVDNLIRRLQAVTRRKAELGLWVGGTPPYGYRYNKTTKEFLEVPEELLVVREIFRLAAEERMGALRAALTLNATGKVRRDGRGWSTKAIRQVLHNKFYCGHMVVRISDPDDPKNVQVIDTKIKQVSPAVSEDVWNAAQALRESWLAKKTPPRHFSTARLFAGLLYCTCGERMAARSHTRRWKRQDGTEKLNRYDEYYCRGAREARSECRSLSTFRQHVVDKVLAQAIADRLRFLNIEEFLKHAEAVITEHDRRLALQLDDHKRRAAEVETSLRKAVASLAEEEDPEIKRRLREHLRELQVEASSRKAEVDKLTKLMEATRAELLSQNGLAERLEQWPKIFAESTDDAIRRRMILDVVDKVILSPDRQATIWLKVDPRSGYISPATRIIATTADDNLGSHEAESIPVRTNENEIVVAFPRSRWELVSPDVVESIRSAHDAGKTFGAIARLLRQQGVPAPHGWKWSAHGVKTVIRELIPERVLTPDKWAPVREIILSAISAGMTTRKIVDLLNEKRVPSPFRGGRWWPSTLWRFSRYIKDDEKLSR